jgi:hypothetical protein
MLDANACVARSRRCANSLKKSPLRGLQTDAEHSEDGLEGAQIARSALSARFRTVLIYHNSSGGPDQMAVLLASADLGRVRGRVRADQTGGGPDASTVGGAVPLPGCGTVIRQFSETDAAGGRTLDGTIATALVSTPLSYNPCGTAAGLRHGGYSEPTAETLWVG